MKRKLYHYTAMPYANIMHATCRNFVWGRKIDISIPSTPYFVGTCPSCSQPRIDANMFEAVHYIHRVTSNLWHQGN